MKIFTEIIGNLHNKDWAAIVKNSDVEYIDLDQWSAQKSRMTASSDHGNEYAISLARHSQLLDGDVVEYSPEHRHITALRIRLSDVMVIDMSALAQFNADHIIHIAVELGHAIGNQHWPAVIKGTLVYVPLTVDKKVMLSVMNTHHIEDITYSFQPGAEVIPYLAPHEVRRLFGGAEQAIHSHAHSEHEHVHQP